MTDFRSPERHPDRPRGLRIGVVSVLIAVVLLAGLFAGILLGRRSRVPEPAPASVVAQPVAGLSPAPAPAPTPALPTDAATLSARETVLANQLAALETRAAALTVTADGAGNQAARAEALLVVLAARRALDRGLGLGPADAQLVARFGTLNPRAVRVIRIAARQPVTLEDLRQALEAIGPAAMSGVSDGWVATVRRELGNLVVLRRAGTPSPRPAEHLARAQRLLAADQVEAALAEVALLPGADDAANWRAAATRYIAARRALDALENAALAGPPPPRPAPVTPLL